MHCQGEANADQVIAGVDQTTYYATMYQTMIADWRERKGMGDFAFGTVQLPPSVAAGTPPAKQINTGRPNIRIAEGEAGSHAGGLTDISGVAVTLDLGGKSAWGYDHPPNKNEISRRLALATLHAAYATQEPLWTGVCVCHSNDVVRFGAYHFDRCSFARLSVQGGRGHGRLDCSSVVLQPYLIVGSWCVP